MKYSAALIAVKDMEVSKKFYQELLDQTIICDLGMNVCFTGGLALQQGFAELVGFDPNLVVQKPHNMELVFEVEDFDGFLKKLEAYEGVKYLHQQKKYEWQQRVVRVFDPDDHIIEIGESMEAIAKRYLSEGYSIEETAKIIMHPVQFVEYCANK